MGGGTLKNTVNLESGVLARLRGASEVPEPAPGRGYRAQSTSNTLSQSLQPEPGDFLDVLWLGTCSKPTISRLVLALSRAFAVPVLPPLQFPAPRRPLENHRQLRECRQAAYSLRITFTSSLQAPPKAGTLRTSSTGCKAKHHVPRPAFLITRQLFGQGLKLPRTNRHASPRTRCTQPTAKWLGPRQSCTCRSVACHRTQVRVREVHRGPVARLKGSSSHRGRGPAEDVHAASIPQFASAAASGNSGSLKLKRQTATGKKYEVGSCRRDGRFSQMVDHQTESTLTSLCLVQAPTLSPKASTVFTRDHDLCFMRLPRYIDVWHSREVSISSLVGLWPSVKAELA